ncbi:hypothetical protein, partial [Hominenteromicrobium sp.]|uniref:hypothetical protein n=2 Tax=Hominenteromicrobium sp. TaxID=3073581 RepID=UPI003AF03D37
RKYLNDLYVFSIKYLTPLFPKCQQAIEKFLRERNKSWKYLKTGPDIYIISTWNKSGKAHTAWQFSFGIHRFFTKVRYDTGKRSGTVKRRPCHVQNSNCGR